MKPNSASYQPALRVTAWLLFSVTVVAVFLARIRLSGLPLERDEGEYAYGGQLLMLGIAPYKLAYSMKLPGTTAAYALIMSILGQSATAIHIGLALTNLITVGLVYFVGRNLLGKFGGIVASACYAVLSLMPHVLGTAGHATHFVVLFALAGSLVLLRSLDRQSFRLIFASGFLFGLAFLMKQPGMFFVLFGLLYLAIHDWRARIGLTKILLRSLLFIIGAAIPGVVTGFLLWNAGVFEKFWFWTFKYATQYGSQVSLGEGLQIFAGHFFGVIGTAWPIWILGLVGLIALAVDRTLRRSAVFLTVFTIFAVLAVCPGLYFRPHYFILFLPALSLMSGAAIVAAFNKLGTKAPNARFAVLSVVAVCFAYPLWSERDFFFELPLAQANVLINGTNPFPESIKIGDYIREQSNPDDKIAVLGSEPQIYFYSKRLSATGYIYTYALMEPQPYAHQMQEEMIREIETNRPRFLVLIVVNKSWLAGRDSDLTILRWADRYCTADYEEIGLINIFDSGTDYYFTSPPTGITPAPDHIVIYRRKT
ncbi:MAG TPA: glycosyltransferase family 39 protein [Chthoniobacterales bacterium]|nr:glycosyltransferase family 39 protein [Chthoniobacterales bacterium]